MTAYPSPPTDLALAQQPRKAGGLPRPSSPAAADMDGLNSPSTAAPRAGSDVLLAELADVSSHQHVPLAEIIDAATKEIYKRLMEVQDVLPSLHESARAKEIFQFALWARRECVRLLAVARWSRHGEAVTKALNLINFLQRQNAQFGSVVDELSVVRSGLSGTRLRNPDILTALDVLTTGQYQRLPTRFQTDFEPVKPLTDGDVGQTLKELNELIAYRLRLIDIVPAEMASYRIAYLEFFFGMAALVDGRVHFHSPGLFKASFSLTGKQPVEGDTTEGEEGNEGGTWYLLSLEWDFRVGGREGVEDLKRDFPTKPPKPVFEEIAHHAKIQLTPTPPPPPLAQPPPDSFDPQTSLAVPGPMTSDSPYVKMHSPVSIDVKLESAEGAKELGGGLSGEEGEERVVDAPLVRVYNLLESLGLTFHLEVLHAQAARMQQLGWAHCFTLELSRDRRAFKISYWPRQRSRTTSGNPTSSAHSTLSVAGTLTLSLVASTLNAPPTPRGTLKRTLNEMENDVKSSAADDDGGGKVRISDKVLGGRLVAEWNVEKKWSGGLEVSSTFALEPVHVDPLNLDMEEILFRSLRSHANALIKAFHKRVVDHPPIAAMYDLAGGDIQLVEEELDVWTIQVRLHGSQVVSVFVDPRSGRIVLRDKNEILAVSGESKLMMSMRMVNDNPAVLHDVLVRLKLAVTNEAVEQRLVYTEPKRTTPAARMLKAATALHAPLITKFEQLHAGDSSDKVQVLRWTKSVGIYCFVYQAGNVRYGLTFSLLSPTARTRRYLIQDASQTAPSQPLPSPLSTNAVPPSPLGSTPTPSRPRFTPIPNLSSIFQLATSKLAARYPVPQHLIDQRKRERNPAPVVMIDGARAAVCELALGVEMLEELDREVFGAAVIETEEN